MIGTMITVTSMLMVSLLHSNFKKLYLKEPSTFVSKKVRLVRITLVKLTENELQHAQRPNKSF